MPTVPAGGLPSSESGAADGVEMVTVSCAAMLKGTELVSIAWTSKV